MYIKPVCGSTGNAITHDREKPYSPVLQGKRRILWARFGQLSHLPPPAVGIPALTSHKRLEYSSAGEEQKDGPAILECGTYYQYYSAGKNRADARAGAAGAASLTRQPFHPAGTGEGADCKHRKGVLFPCRSKWIKSV